MRIGIDARFYGSVGKGLGRYTEKLIKNLEEIDKENQYFILLRKENFHEYIPKNKNFQKILADYQWYSFSEQIRMPFLLYKLKLDLVHFPHFNIPLLYRKKFIITIHDLILLHFPTLRGTTLNPILYWLKFLAYKFTILAGVHFSKKILTVSNFTKNDILNHYGIDKEKIVVTYEACENHCNSEDEKDEEILQKYGIIKPYLLYVGNAYPHKNLERLINAFDIFKKRKRSGINLVLVGKHDYFYNGLKNFIEKKEIKNVILPGYVKDQHLSCVYRNALLYVFPSLYEGFGLPPLEAMSKGLPVVSSDHECMKEILGSGAYFVDCTKEKEMSNAFSMMIDDVELRSKFIEKGFERVKLFSWKEMAKMTFEEYKN